MLLLADENLPAPLIAELRQRGHDVLSVKESHRGAADDDLLALAQTQGRIIVTKDKDFGALAFAAGLPANCGIILLRLVGLDRDAEQQRTIEVLESRSDWAGKFAVITNERIRLRPLPA